MNLMMLRSEVELWCTGDPKMRHMVVLQELLLGDFYKCLHPHTNFAVFFFSTQMHDDTDQQEAKSMQMKRNVHRIFVCLLQIFLH